MNAQRITFASPSSSTRNSLALQCGLVAIPAMFLPWGLAMQHVYAAAYAHAQMAAARDRFAMLTRISNN